MFSKTSGSSLPFWYDSRIQDAIPNLSFGPLKENVETQVTIIGGGITGLTCAYLLARDKKRVILVEDGEIASAESGRTTAHLMSALDDRYYNLQKLHGKEGARLACESSKRAIDLIERIVTEEKIECEFTRLDGYLFLSEREPNNISKLENEWKAATESGLEVDMLDCIPAISGPCLRFKDQGQFNPLKYYNGLAASCTKLGVQIFTQTHAAKINGGFPAQIVTTEGLKITSEHIIVATNVPVNDRVTLLTKLQPYRTYAISALIKKNSVPLALYWDTEDPYHYVRLSPCSEPGYETLIVGGEDHLVGQSHDFEERYNRLIEWTQRRFPIEKILHRWSGQVIEPIDGLPYSGRNPNDHSNVFVHTGDSGTGLTNGTLGAMLITDLIMGRQNPWEKIYDPSRISTTPIKEWISHNVTVQTQYKDWITGSDIQDIEELGFNEGAVVRKGLKKVAVYRDPQGKFFQCSAICPHLGGIVNWNSSEKTWDCPVHGSRFDPLGVVLNGPANCNLAPEDRLHIDPEKKSDSIPNVAPLQTEIK